MSGLLAASRETDVLATMGHATTKLIFRNYRHRVKQTKAEAWWGLLPGCVVAVPMSA